MRPAFRRGWEGEGKPESMPWRGPAGEARHTGAFTSGFGNERAKPLVFSSGIARRSREHRHPCNGAKPTEVLRTRSVRQRASGNERGKSACGLAQECRALRSAECAGQSASTRNSRSTSNAPDRHPNGPGLQPRSAPADRAGRPKGQPFRPYTNSLSASLQNQLENPPQILQTGIEQIANKIVSQGCHSGIKTTPCRKLSQR